jgi:hypothetical protein
VVSVTHTELWQYRDTAVISANELEGFAVRATDGDIGKIDEMSDEVGSSFIVVDTGPWIFGRKVVLPAGVIERIDLDARAVDVRLTKDQIKNSPEYDADQYRDPAYRDQLDLYYGSM